jgi:Tetratricopeptide repeat
MSKKKESQFRERLPEMGVGLVREQAPKRPDVDGLVLDTSFDITELEDFSRSSADKAGDVEKFKPPTEGGLSFGELDADNLDEALHKIQQQQINEQITSLLDEAMRLMEEEQYPAALRVLDEALAIVPGSTAVLYLKGRCLFFLGLYEEAYDLLTLCREGVTDSETLITVLSLQGACARAVIDDIEAQLDAFRAKRQDEAALRLIENSLRRMPYSPTLLYHRCGVLLAMGRLAQAKSAALVGLERGGEENAALFQQMYDQAAEREIQPLLEPIRQALRAFDTAKAVKLLQSQRAMLSGQERYESARSYAHEKSPSRSGVGLRALFSRDKEAPPEPLTDERRQRILQWLLADELDAGYDAMERDDYKQANAHFRAAADIDGECRIISYLHGLSIYRGFLLLLSDENAVLDLQWCMKELQVAADYVRRAAADPLISERCTALASAVKHYYDQLVEIERERKRREEESRPVNEVLKFYNETMDYLEKNRVGSMKVLLWARDRFRQIIQHAEKERRRRSKEQGGEILDRLIVAVNKHLLQLDQIEGDVKIQEAVNDCVDGFNQMIDYYRRYSITSYTEKYRAQEKVKNLLEKVSSARTLLGYNASQDRKKDSLPKLLTSYSSSALGSAHDIFLGMMKQRTKPPHVDQETWDVLNRLEEALLDVQKQLD